MRTKMPTGRYLHGAHGALYFDKTLNLLALGLSRIICPLLFFNLCNIFTVSFSLHLFKMNKSQ